MLVLIGVRIHISAHHMLINGIQNTVIAGMDNLTLTSGQYKWGDGLPVVHEDMGVYPWYSDNPKPGNMTYVRLSRTKNDETYPFLLRNNSGEKKKFAYICSP